MAQSFDRNHESLNQLPIDDLRLLSGPFWGELRVFLAVAKAKSFNKAAEALNISQPTVGRQIRRLQDIMKSQLLVSSNNGISLTEKGKELADSLLLLDQKLFSISHELRAETSEAEGLVRLSCTEALAGLFLVPSLLAFNEQYPKIQIHVRNPVNLIGFRENQSDIVLAYAPSAHADVETLPVGFVHLIPIATQPYISRRGIPTRKNLESHFFIDAGYYSSENETWNTWRRMVDRGTVAHLCDNSFAYGLMVKSGIGVGLLGSFTLADPDAVPLDLDLHIKLPLFLLASSERLQSKPVRIVYDWLAGVYGPNNPWLAASLSFEGLPRNSLAHTFLQLYADTSFNTSSSQ